MRLRFVAKPNKDSAPLRDADVDLETGVISEATAPEIRAQGLFRDRFVGVVRAKHPLAAGWMTVARYAGGRHVLVSRRGANAGPVDVAMEPLGLRREIAAIVSGFSAALALVRGSDLVATVPERHTETLRAGMFTFRLPLRLPEITVSLLWHPRLDADPAHQWLRECVRAVCGVRP